MLIRFIFISVIVLYSIPAYSEYRVFQYIVQDLAQEEVDSKPKIVLSSLDPVSYLAYHGGQTSIKVGLVRTWICPGHTGLKPYCKSPYGQAILIPELEKEKEGGGK